MQAKEEGVRAGLRNSSHCDGEPEQEAYKRAGTYKDTVQWNIRFVLVAHQTLTAFNDRILFPVYCKILLSYLCFVSFVKIKQLFRIGLPMNVLKSVF